MPYITAALALYGVGSSIYKQQEAKKAIKKLERFRPAFRSGADIQREAEAMVQRGYSPEEEASFRSSLARRSNAAYQKATQVNPNLSSQVQAGINYGNVGALTDYAARDAQLRRQRVQDYVNLTRGQSNQQTQADLISKREREIAYGNAKNQADSELYNQLAMLGYAGSQFKGSGSNQTTTPTATGNALNGNAPMRSYQNEPVNPSYYGSNQWGRDLYGNPTGRTDQQFNMMDTVYTYPYRRPNPYVSELPAPYNPY